MIHVPLFLFFLQPRFHPSILRLPRCGVRLRHVCHFCDGLVKLCYFAGLLLCRVLHAAPPVSEGPGGRRDLTPSPLSVLVSLHRLKCVFVCSPRSDGCHRCRHLHRHIHSRVAPPVRRFSLVQASPRAHSAFGHHFCQSHTSSGVVPIIVARSLVDASGRSRSLP